MIRPCWSEAEIDAYEERAAIMQFDAGRSRPDAEKAAEDWVMRTLVKKEGTQE